MIKERKRDRLLKGIGKDWKNTHKIYITSKSNKVYSSYCGVQDALFVLAGMGLLDFRKVGICHEWKLKDEKTKRN